MPWATVWDNVYLPLRLQGEARAAAAGADRRDARGGRARRLRARLSARAFGRHADARLDRARAGHRAAAPAARRAVRRARRDHALQAQRGSAAAVAGAPLHHRLRHAQRLRIRVPVEPHRGDDAAAGPRRSPTSRSICPIRATRSCAPRPTMPSAAATCRGAWRRRADERRVARPAGPHRRAVRGRRADARGVGGAGRCRSTSRPISCQGRCSWRRRCGATGRACWARCWVTLRITLAALAAAILLGGALAVLFAQSRLLERCLFPYAVILQVTPIVSIAPLIIIWVNDTFLSLLVCAWIVAFFPIVANTTLGPQQRRPQPRGAVPALRRVALADAALSAHAVGAALFPRGRAHQRRARAHRRGGGGVRRRHRRQPRPASPRASSRRATGWRSRAFSRRCCCCR